MELIRQKTAMSRSGTIPGLLRVLTQLPLSPPSPPHTAQHAWNALQSANRAVVVQDKMRQLSGKALLVIRSISRCVFVKFYAWLSRFILKSPV